ncbi:MAG: pentapeptide repeat-containing protein [Frankia sp.]
MDLTNASLHRATLTGAHLAEADLTGTPWVPAARRIFTRLRLLPPDSTRPADALSRENARFVTVRARAGVLMAVAARIMGVPERDVHGFRGADQRLGGPAGGFAGGT